MPAFKDKFGGEVLNPGSTAIICFKILVKINLRADYFKWPIFCIFYSEQKDF